MPASFSEPARAGAVEVRVAGARVLRGRRRAARPRRRGAARGTRPPRGSSGRRSGSPRASRRDGASCAPVEALATHAPHESSGPDGGRADVPRRAGVRHLLAAAERADRLPRHPGDRGHREPDRRPADPPRVRGPGQGHLDLHQLAGRLGLRGPRDLRRDAVHQARRLDHLRRRRDEHGRAAARRRRRGQADGAAELEDPDPPGLGRLLRARRPTSRSTPRRSSTSASASTRSSPSTPARPSRRSRRTPSATTS